MRTLGAWAIRLCALFLTLVWFGCAPARLEPGEGHVDVPGGSVWYRVVGSGPGTPLLVLHGGPGVPSYYLKPLAALGDERPVVFYDQLGCGHSDHPTDSTLWTIPHFVQELAAVRSALGIRQVHLFGHSWGSILATEYMLTKPAGVRSLILAGPALSIPLWEHDADSLRRLLPDTTQQKILRHEQDGSFDSPEYQSAMMEYYAEHVAHRQPWGPDLDSSFTQLAMPVYGYMQGPSEFTITGTLKGYDVTPRLHELDVPTLVTAGQYDQATPSTAAHLHSLIPKSELVVIEGGGHITWHDQPDRYVQVLREFLRRQDQSGR